MRKHKEAFIISIEGIDASGKTILSEELKNYLSKKDKIYYNDKIVDRIYNFNFPNYNGVCGNAIKILLNRKIDIDLRKVLATLFALDRFIFDYCDSNVPNILIFNRYYGSNFAYNFDLGLEWLSGLEKGSYECDVTFVLDINPEISFNRRTDRRDSFEESIDFLSIIRKRYLDLAKQFGWVVLDGAKETGDLVDQVYKHITTMNNGISHNGRNGGDII